MVNDETIQITLSIADYPIKIWGKTEIIEKIKHQYHEFIKETEEKSRFALFVDGKNTGKNVNSSTPHPQIKFGRENYQVSDENSSGNINLITKSGEFTLRCLYNENAVEYFLRILYCLIIFDSGGLLIHAAGIIHRQQAYLFCSHSGGGKTTVAKLSDQRSVLNDDLIILNPSKNSQWIAYRTPFSKDSWEEPMMNCAPVKCVIFLAKDQNAWIEPISIGESLAELVANIPIISMDRIKTQDLLQRGVEFLQKVQYYRLHFRKDPSFWEVIDSNELSGKYM